MYHVSAQGVDERMINVHYYYYYYCYYYYYVSQHDAGQFLKPQTVSKLLKD